MTQFRINLKIAAAVFAFLTVWLLPPGSLAADGSGANIVSPTSTIVGSVGNVFNFTFTAAETMDSGEIKLLTPIGWSTIQGVAGTAGYTTVSSAAGIIADVVNALDAVTDWTATQHMSLATSTDVNAASSPASTFSLANTITATAVANEQWYFNYGSAANWGTVASDNLRVGMWLKSDVNTASGDIAWQDDNSADLASPLDTVNMPALSSNVWTYTSATLGATSRTSVLSYGFRYSNDIGAVTMKADSLSTIFSANDTNAGWSGDGGIADSLITGAGNFMEGTGAVRCTYAGSAGIGTSGDCFDNEGSVITVGPGTTVSFWVRPSIALNAGDFAWVDDNAGNLGSADSSVSLPALPANIWTYVTLTSATSGDLRSFGLRQLVDRGALTIDIDAIAKIIDTADSTTGWTAPTSAVQILSADSVIFHEGTASLKNVIAASASAGDVWYQAFGATQNWSGFTTVGFWIRSTVNTLAGDLQFQYSSGGDLSSPIATLDIGALSANTWTFQKLTLSGVRTSVNSFGIKYATDLGAATVNLDDILIGPGGPTFVGGAVDVRLLSLANTETVLFTYGSGGGASGVTAPSSEGTATATTTDRVSDSGTLTNIASQPTLTARKLSTSIVLESSANPSVYGNSVTFAATITPESGGAPSGTVIFKDGSMAIGTGILNGANPGVAAFATSSLNVADSPHSITAVYAGDSTFSGSTSDVVSQAITAKALTVTGITADNKVYDRTASATLNVAGATLVGVISGDTVALNTGSAVGTFATSSVGTGISVQVSGLTISGSSVGNYSLTQPTTTANITAANLTVSGITANDKVYDGTTSATLNTGSAALVGVISGDTVNLDTSGAAGTFATSSVGTGILVTISGLTINGASAPNYSLTQPTTTASITNPIPTTASITPTSTTAGAGGFTLTVNGTNFIASSTVQINGSSRATSFVSSTQVTATVLAADIASVGTASVTVVNPAPGGGTSNAQTLTITSATTKFVIIAPAPGTVDAPITVTVQAQKADDSVDTAYQSDVTLNTTGSATGGGLVDIMNGVGTKNLSDTVAETVTLSLSDTQGTGLNVSSTQVAAFAPGAITQFSLNDVGSISADSRAAYTVSRKDQFNNLVTGSTTIAYLYSNSTSSVGAFYSVTTGGSPITSVTIVNGTSSADFWYADDPGVWMITVSDSATAPDGAAGIADAEDSLTVNVVATKFIISAPATSTVGVAANVQVQAQDDAGRLATTYGGGVTLNTTGSATGGGLVDIVNGVGTKNLSDTVAETVNLSLQDTESTGLNASSTDSIAFLPDSTSQFTLNDPGNMNGGTRLGYTVSRKDQFSNLISGGDTPVYLYSDSTGPNKAFFDAASGGNQIASTTILSGSASSNFWYYEDFPGTWTISVSDNAVAPDGATGADDATDSVTVAPGAVKFVFANVPASATAGDSVTFNVEAVDSLNNIDTSFQQGVTLVASGSASGGGLITIVNGVGTSTVSDTVAETVNLSLQDTQSTGLNISSTASIVFAAGPVSQFTLNDPGNMNGGTRLGYTVSRKDQFGNLVSAGTNSVYLYSNSSSSNEAFFDAATGGNQIASTTISDNSTSTQFWYFDDMAGTWDITVSDNAISPDGATGSDDATDSVTVAPGAVKFVFANVPASATAGDSVTFNVEAVDSFDNIDTSFQQDVTITKTGSATGGGLVDVMNGIATSTITDLVAETVALGLQDTQGAGLGVSDTESIVFNALPPSPPTPATSTEPTPTASVPLGVKPSINLKFAGWAYPGAAITLIRKDAGLLQTPIAQNIPASADGTFSVQLNNVLRLTGQTYLLSFADREGRIAQTKAYNVPAEENLAYEDLVVAPTFGFENDSVVARGSILIITGYATPKGTVEIFVDGASQGTISVQDSSGKYRFVLPTDDLTIGRHAIVAHQTYQGVKSDFSNQKSFTVSPLSNPRADLNGDGAVDIKDISIFLVYLKDLGTEINRFRSTNTDILKTLDLNRDGVLDVGDLSIILRAVGGSR